MISHTPSASVRQLLIPVLTGFLAACATTGAPAPADEDGAGVPEHAWVLFGADTVRAEVARTEAARARGLMLRDRVPAGTGMLFVFPESEIQGVWMKDTLVPLDAAFMDEDRIITQIERLEPGDETVRYSEVPVAYVLEVPRGWLGAHGIEVGDRARIVFQGDPPAP